MFKYAVPEGIKPRSEDENKQREKKIKAEGRKIASNKKLNFGQKVELILRQTQIYTYPEQIKLPFGRSDGILETVSITPAELLVATNRDKLEKRKLLLTELSEEYKGKLDLTNPDQLKEANLRSLLTPPTSATQNANIKTVNSVISVNSGTQKLVAQANSANPTTNRTNKNLGITIASELEQGQTKFTNESNTPKQKVETPVETSVLANKLNEKIDQLVLQRAPAFIQFVPTPAQLEAAQTKQKLKEEQQIRQEEKLERLQDIENVALEKPNNPTLITPIDKSIGERIRVFGDKLSVPDFLRPSSKGETIYKSKKIEKEGEKIVNDKTINFAEKIERILKETPIYEAITEKERRNLHPELLTTLGKTEETYLEEKNSYNMKKRKILLTKLSEIPDYKGTIDINNPKHLNEKTLMEIVKKGSISNIEDIKEAKQNITQIEEGLMKNSSVSDTDEIIDLKMAESTRYARDKEGKNFGNLFIPTIETYGKSRHSTMPSLVDQIRIILTKTPIFTNLNNFTIIEKAKELNMNPNDFMAKVNAESMNLRKRVINRLVSDRYVGSKIIRSRSELNLLEGNDKYTTDGLTSLMARLNHLHY